MTDAIASEMLGVEIARRALEASSADAAVVVQRLGREPCLATIIVRNDPSSKTFVRMRRNQCHRARVDPHHQAFPERQPHLLK